MKMFLCKIFYKYWTKIKVVYRKYPTAMGKEKEMKSKDILKKNYSKDKFTKIL